MRLIAAHLQESLGYIRTRIPRETQVAIVLGSGLGEFADTLEHRQSISATDIPHYPTSSVPGHKGVLAFGEIGNICILAFQGRVHLYETGSPDTVTYPVRLAHALGAKTFIVTNAAGGINRRFEPGDLMVIGDQIDLAASSRKLEGIGNRGLRIPYTPSLLEKAIGEARKLGLPVHRGVYAGVLGPSYETTAEVEMLHRIGADAVGMSTVAEVEMASELGMQVLGISCITNKATGIGTSKLSHDEVTIVANKVKADFNNLLTHVIKGL